MKMREPFAVKDCALIAIATGEQAQTLRELRDRLETTSTSCIYYHFWGGLLRARFDDPEYQNDFAVWAYRSLHDKALAERLALINPTDYHYLEDLRRELIDSIEERLDESEYVPWAKSSQRFHFVRSQIVVFDTDTRIEKPYELPGLLQHMSPGTIFYHFIDARRRPPFGRDDFTEWIAGFSQNYHALTDALESIDPYFTNLIELREELSLVMSKNMLMKG